MSLPLDDALMDPQRLNTELQSELAEMRRRLDEAQVERDESEAQKAAMAEVLQVINASAGDLAPVFDFILEKAHILIPLGR